MSCVLRDANVTTVRFVSRSDQTARSETGETWQPAKPSNKTHTYTDPPKTIDAQQGRRSTHIKASPGGVDCRPAMWQSFGREYTSNIR
eukprot:7616683-Pyramimonas_sp.AAC.1